MATTNEDCTNDTEDTLSEMQWADIQELQHRYLVNFPKSFKKDIDVHIELPYPVFSPVLITDHEEYNKVFKNTPKQDTRFEFYKKLYSNTNQNLLAKDIREKECVSMPQYVLDIAEGAFENIEDPAWAYTGGMLDCFSFNNADYVVRTDLKCTLHVTQLDEPSNNISKKFDKYSSSYGLKTCVRGKDVFAAVRQKSKVSLFNLFGNDSALKVKPLWKVKTLGFFVDMAFNKFKKSEISIVDDSRNLKIKDFKRNRDLISYNFPTERNTLSDCSANVDYIDDNTVCFMDRCYIYLLDVRSLALKKSCFTKTWLKCDDLCTFSKCNDNSNSICVASTHNFMKFDIRSLKFGDKVSHMLSTSPLISSTTTNTYGEYVCLAGQTLNDKVLVYNNTYATNIPQNVPNVNDALTATNLARKITCTEFLEERLSLPILGMKLYNDNVSGNVVLFTSNAVGDVFKQNILQTKPDSIEAVNKFPEWINMLPHQPKVLEATSLCNLNNIMNTVCRRFPQDKKIISLMKENEAHKLFDKDFAALSKQLEGNVGQAMNAIWTDEVIAEADSGVSSSVTSKHKVSEWLDSVW